MNKENNYIKIFDTTLRDGEQSPGASMNIEEMIKIPKVLNYAIISKVLKGYFSFKNNLIHKNRF